MGMISFNDVSVPFCIKLLLRLNEVQNPLLDHLLDVNLINHVKNVTTMLSLLSGCQLRFYHLHSFSHIVSSSTVTDDVTN